MRRLIQAVGAALLIVMLLCCAAAAEGEFVLQDVKIGSQDMQLIIKSTDGYKQKPADFEIKIGEQTAQATAMTPIYKSDISMTHLFIVDTSAVSNTNNNNRLSDMKAMVHALLKTMRPGDNAAVVTPGMAENAISLSDSTAVLDAVLESLKFDKENKALDTAIRSACSFLRYANDIKDRVRIVIISNGENETLSTAVISEMSGQLAEARAAVYTVAFTKAKLDSSRVSGFKLLSLQSRGGVPLEIEYKQDRKPATEDQINQMITPINNNENYFYTLTVPLNEGLAENPVISIQVQGGSLALSDSLTLTDEELQQIRMIMPEATTTPPPPPPPDPTLIERIVTWLKDNVILAVGIAVIVVLVIVVLVLLLGKKKPAPEPIPNSIDGGHTEPVVKSAIRVSLQPVSPGDILVRNVPAEIDGAIQIGRREDQCRIVIAGQNGEQDIRTVSRIHARLISQGDTILIENLSQNGTKVNNEKISCPTVVQNNDIITLGSVNFRVTIQKG